MSEHFPPQGPPKIAGVPIQPVRPVQQVETDPISLVDEGTGTTPGASKIRSLSGGPLNREPTYKRPTIANGRGAVRVRSFHGRMSEEGLKFLDEKINEWLDQHADIEVKFVTSTIGQFEGKIREQALVLNIWY